MSYTIYDNNVWYRMLEKYPDLKELALDAGVESNPEKAREIRAKFKHNFGLGELSEIERKLARRLSSIEFVEQHFLNYIILKGSFAHSVGADEDSLLSFGLVLLDFNCTFDDFIETCQKRNENIENISFAKAYEIFLEVIQLKLECKVPYTKLFIRKLLEMSSCKTEDSLEIKTYFLENDPTMFRKISQELLVDGSK